MPTEFAAIPTEYAGIRFRSRLEAKWAAFFDLCGWRWSYEPFDLDGWIPDFALGDQLQTLVEIKPAMNGEELEDATRQQVGIQKCAAPVLLLGADPTLWSAVNAEQEEGEPPEIGLVSFRDSDERLTWTVNFGYTEGNGELGLCSMDGPWQNLVWTAPKAVRRPNKWSRVWAAEDIWFSESNPARHDLEDRWAAAINAVQWRRKKSRKEVLTASDAKRIAIHLTRLSDAGQ